MLTRSWLRASMVGCLMVASVALTAPARTTEAPVVTAPAQGAQVPLGFSGPVAIDYSGVAPGTYQVELRAEEGSDLHQEVLPEVQVTDSTGVVSFRLTDSLDKPGAYTVHTWWDGSQGVSSPFTVQGGEPPLILSPGRRVARGEPWRLKIDWTKAPIAYYGIDLYRVGYVGSCCEFWVEMFPNHEDRTVTDRPMDPILQKGRYYIELGHREPTGWVRTTRYFQVS